jgi:hypothetical protein
VEDALHKWDVEVGHLQHFPLLMAAEPEALLDSDRPNYFAYNRISGVVRRHWVAIGCVHDRSGVIDCDQLWTLDLPERLLVGFGKAAEEIHPPGKKLAFVRIVEDRGLHALTGDVLARRIRRKRLIQVYNSADMACTIVEELLEVRQALIVYPATS